ncbi:MAG: rhodanese-like domain-containing protein [Gammaproteobacteria bacterium]
MSIIMFLYAHWVLSSLFVVFLLGYIAFEMRVRYMGPKRLAPQEAVVFLNQKSPILLDLRDKSKFDQGHIIKARQCAVADLQQTLEKLKVSKEQPIILVCQLGQTTMSAGAKLKQLGFTEVYQLAGGMQAWTTAELPVEKA